MNSAVRTVFFRNDNFRPLSEPGEGGSARIVPLKAGRNKPRYQVDLSGQQADCEANYLRLRKLLPELTDRDQWLFHIGSGAVTGQLHVNVVERAPYTTTLELTQPDEWGGNAATPLRAPTLIVCMYHDADMAEAVGWENHRRLRARYDYPNHKMYQCDEKAQLNRFLADWLTICQAEGRVVFDLARLKLYK